MHRRDGQGGPAREFYYLIACMHACMHALSCSYTVFRIDCYDNSEGIGGHCTCQ